MAQILLTDLQKSVLDQMARDAYGYGGLDLSYRKLALKYKTSLKTICKIFEYLKRLNLVQFLYDGSKKYIKTFSDEIFEFLKAPVFWLRKFGYFWHEHTEDNESANQSDNQSANKQVSNNEGLAEPPPREHIYKYKEEVLNNDNNVDAGSKNENIPYNDVARLAMEDIFDAFPAIDPGACHYLAHNYCRRYILDAIAEVQRSHNIKNPIGLFRSKLKERSQFNREPTLTQNHSKAKDLAICAHNATVTLQHVSLNIGTALTAIHTYGFRRTLASIKILVATASESKTHLDLNQELIKIIERSTEG